MKVEVVEVVADQQRLGPSPRALEHLGLAPQRLDGDREIRSGGLEEGLATILEKDAAGIRGKRPS